jgi:hypothetical protein
MAIDKKTRQKLGKFYTPSSVAEFCWRVLLTRIGHESLYRLRVVDPAAGDGVFLQEACRRRWINAERVIGVELYPGEIKEPPLYRSIIGNGLLDQSEQGFQSGEFDLVIGNPPFGGDGFRGFDEEQKQQVLMEILRHYNAWRGSNMERPPHEGMAAPGLTDADAARAFKKVATCPIEQLFLERFLMLCADGGWCVIILPEGLLANYRGRWLREAVHRTASIEAVVSLPARLFAGEGALARTAVVFLRKKTGLSTPVYLASPTFFQDSARLATQEYLEQVEQELTGIKPANVGLWLERDQWTAERWDPGFWNPRFTKGLLKSEHSIELGELIESITYGPILPGQKPILCQDGIPLIGQKQLIETGINLASALRVKVGSAFDPPRSRVETGDLLLARSGEGALLRFKMGVYGEPGPANVSCFVDRIRLRGIDPYYVWLVLKSSYLRTQILRLQNGVGTPNLSFREIRSLRIPWLAPDEQLVWRERYMERVAPLHNQRLRIADQREKVIWDERADREFQRLIRALEDAIGKRFGVPPNNEGF